MPLRERRLVQAIQLVRLERLAQRFLRLVVLPWIRLAVANNTSRCSVAEDGRAARPASTKKWLACLLVCYRPLARGKTDFGFGGHRQVKIYSHFCQIAFRKARERAQNASRARVQDTR